VGGLLINFRGSLSPLTHTHPSPFSFFHGSDVLRPCAPLCRTRAISQERDERARELVAAKNEAEEHGDTIYDLRNSLRHAQDEVSRHEAKAAAAAAAAAAAQEAALQRQKEVFEAAARAVEEEAQAEREAARKVLAEAEQVSTLKKVVVEKNGDDVVVMMMTRMRGWRGG